MSAHVWEITLAVLLLVLAFDFAMAYRQRNVETSLTTAVSWTLFYVAAAVVFGISLGQWADTQSQNEFFAGWLTEYALSVDNIFVFVIILARLKIESKKQQLVLLLGIIIALLLRGGFIGFITGLIPGVGGAVGDFLAYGATKAAHKEPQEVPFGEGNPIGLLGCEGANNAQKVSSMIPAMLFGIPAAPFAAMVMAIAMYFGMEIGTVQLLNDKEFVWSMAFGYIFGTIGVALLSIVLYKWIIKILEVPYWIYALFITVVIIYANMQYSHSWEDLALLAIFSTLGIFLKFGNISRPAVLVAFVVADKFDDYLFQTLRVYRYQPWGKTFEQRWENFEWSRLFSITEHPIFIASLVISALLFLNSFRRKDRGIDYT